MFNLDDNNPSWLQTKEVLTPFRKNKKNKNNNPSPLFIPSKENRPEYAPSHASDDVIVYVRTGRGLKEEKTPPPYSSNEAYDESLAKQNKHPFRFLEQNMKNHAPPEDVRFLNKGAQILFNKNNIYPIHRNKLRDRQVVLMWETSQTDYELEEDLYYKNLDLYEDSYGNARLKDSIRQKQGSYYFDVD